MKLYHGTAARSLNSALKHGLRPRFRTDSNWQENPSHPEMVYLTTAYPFYFGCLSRSDKKLVAFELDGDALDKKCFFPDEDFITELLGRHEGRGLTLEEKGQVRIMIRTYQNHWRNSLRFLGNCAYRGTIPASAITRYCLFMPAARPAITAELIDPSINTMNFQEQGWSLPQGGGMDVRRPQVAADGGRGRDGGRAEVVAGGVEGSDRD